MFIRQLQRLFFEVQSIKPAKNSIDLASIAGQFKKHFQEEYQKYQMPLLSTEGSLAYTSRFAKTVINQQFNQDHRKGYFMLIKKSIASNKQFTIQSCVDICESLINFQFQGQENRILEKMRNYAKAHQPLFNSKQSDRFNRAHRFLMAQRAYGAIKFNDFKLSPCKTQKQHIQQNLKFALQKQKIGNVHIDWSAKKQISFSLEFKGIKRLIKIYGLQENKSQPEQIQLLSNRIQKLSAKDSEILLIINPYQQFKTINTKQLNDLLLCQPTFFHTLQQSPDINNSKFYGKLIKNLLIKNSSNSTIKVTNTKQIDFLNYILKQNSIDELKQLFGYIKLNIFHIQFQRLMISISKASKTYVGQIDPLSYVQILEQEQKIFKNMVSYERFYARAILNLLANHNLDRLNVFCNESKILPLIKYLLHLRKKEKSEENKQNRTASILMTKLALSSTLYQIPLFLPSINQNMRKYHKALHPITYKFHQK